MQMNILHATITIYVVQVYCSTQASSAKGPDGCHLETALLTCMPASVNSKQCARSVMPYRYATVTAVSYDWSHQVCSGSGASRGSSNLPYEYWGMANP